MILGDGAKVFDLSQEKDDLRSRYGHRPWSEKALTTFGQCCLVARRLVERGVPYININNGGWDTHTEHFRTMQQKLPELDQGLATLLADLSDRGLLDTTIVWWCGEFGRTPKIDWQPPWNGGRNHFGKVFSAVDAGGGFHGGRVVGASDAKGEEVQDRPVYPCDLIGSIYELLGIDPDGKLPNPMNFDHGDGIFQQGEVVAQVDADADILTADAAQQGHQFRRSPVLMIFDRQADTVSLQDRHCAEHCLSALFRSGQ